MIFQNVIFYTDLNINKKYPAFIQSLLSHNINLFFLKETMNSSLPSGIKRDNCLLITDKESGAVFANQSNIPFIAKDLSTGALSEAVCLFDSFEFLSYDYLKEQWQRAHHLPLTISSKERFSLRELTVEDIPNLYAILKEPEVSKYLPPLLSLSEELEKHKEYIKYGYEFFGYGLWGIFNKSNKLIGQAGLQNVALDELLDCSVHFNPADSILELSYLIEKSSQGQGIARESILAIYQFALNKLECNTLYCFIAKQNLASIKTAMDMGMNKIGTTKYKGFLCNIYCIDNISEWLPAYLSEAKFRKNSVSLWKKAQIKPVQNVYKKIYLNKGTK